MASQGFHERRKDLSRETRDLHRALVSLGEELEVVDWYCQRADACRAAVDRLVLVDEHAGVLVIGQDMRVGYAGSDGIHYQLFACESLVLRLDEPGAVCVLTP